MTSDRWWEDEGDEGGGRGDSLDETASARRDFGRLQWRLLWLANVDRRDVVEHTDRSRYTAIGAFMLLFGLYSFAGWMAFLSSAGVGRLGQAGWVLEVAGALIGAIATLTFDRALVGTIRPNLDYSVVEAGQLPSTPQDDDDPEADDFPDGAGPKPPRQPEATRPLPGITGKSSRGPIAARLVIAVIIGLFTTQAVDLTLFAKDIDQQRADRQVVVKQAELTRLTDRHVADVREHQTAKSAARDQLVVAKQRQADARKWSHGVCRPYLTPTSNRPSRCMEATRVELEATAQLRRLARDDPAERFSRSGKPFFDKQDTLNGDILELRANPSSSRVEGGGPNQDTQDLVAFLEANPASLLLYAALLILALLLDLSAILLKVSGFDSVYERRQALRGWWLWWRNSLATQRATVVEQFGLREEFRSQLVEDVVDRNSAATDLAVDASQQRIAREALLQAEQDPEVLNEWGIWAREELILQAQIKRQRHAPPPPPPSPPPGPPPGPEDPGDELRPGARFCGASRQWWVLDHAVFEQGGHSSVWRAHLETNPTHVVAMKFMSVTPHKQFDANAFDVATARAQNELNWLVGFSRHQPSRHLVELIDQSDGSATNYAWHATRWARYGTLWTYYSPTGNPRPLFEILEFGRQILEGLLEAGTPGGGDPVHEDLKPANILVDDARGGLPAGIPRLRVTDWGLAKDFGDGPEIGFHEFATLEFAAPELLNEERRGPVHVAEDLFSFGAILWWCVTGHAPGKLDALRPPPGSSLLDYQDYIYELGEARANMPALHEIQPGVPVALSNFIRGLLSESPDARLRVLGKTDVTMFGRDDILQAAKRRVKEFCEQIRMRDEQEGDALVVYPEPWDRGQTAWRGSPSPASQATTTDVEDEVAWSGSGTALAAPTDPGPESDPLAWVVPTPTGQPMGADTPLPPRKRFGRKPKPPRGTGRFTRDDKQPPPEPRGPLGRIARAFRRAWNEE
jgi:serine/threonine protein kinase